jgi:methyltransferase
MTFPLAVLLAVAISMAGELWLSKRNERRLLARGASAPPDPAYRTMRWAYPFVFLAMGGEGMLLGRPPATLSIAGGAIFVVAKALKYWAVASLGDRWTFRVFVLPGAPLVTSGPYRLLRHPNYVAVVGELVGIALLVGARLTGPMSVVLFGWLLRRRIDAEERALGMREVDR